MWRLCQKTVQSTTMVLTFRPFLIIILDALNLLQSNLEIAAKELEVAMDYRIYILIICCLLIVICLALCIAYMKFLKIDCLPKSSKASETSESDDETKDLVWLTVWVILVSHTRANADNLIVTELIKYSLWFMQCFYLKYGSCNTTRGDTIILNKIFLGTARHIFKIQKIKIECQLSELWRSKNGKKKMTNIFFYNWLNVIWRSGYFIRFI